MRSGKLAFNRTIVELKSDKFGSTYARPFPFNRTIVELKFAWALASNAGRLLLIVLS